MGLDDNLLNNNSFTNNSSNNSLNQGFRSNRIDSLRKEKNNSSASRRASVVYEKMKSLGSSGRELQKKAYSKLQEIQKKTRK